MRDEYDFSQAVRNPYAKKLKKQITTELDAIPDNVRKEIRKAPSDAEGVFPYPFEGEV